MTSELKDRIYLECKKHIDIKLSKLHAELDKIKESLQSETKSTAGDKHETGRAMMQLERERLGQQLLQFEKMQGALQKINLESNINRVTQGSLVRTDRAMYFISIAVGKVDIEGSPVYCVSTEAPIVKILSGKTVGDTVTFNGQLSTILEIL